MLEQAAATAAEAQRGASELGTAIALGWPRPIKLRDNAPFGDQPAND